MKSILNEIAKPAVGLVLCSAFALLAAVTLPSHPWRVFAPLAFAVLIIMLSARYGLLVSVLGSVVTALVFAYFAYAPIGSFRVENASERSSLGWMILASVSLSFLLLPSDHVGHRH